MKHQKHSLAPQGTRTATIIDSIMGSGKTTYMINHLNSLAWQQGSGKIIFITPNLNEVDRITAACPLLKFKNPIPKHGKKYWDFMELIEQGNNICTTHSLFRRLDREAQAILKRQGYHLVIDEALDVVEQYKDLSKQDLQSLMAGGFITIEEGTGLLLWDETKEYTGKHTVEREHCRNKALFYRGDKLLFWEFPITFMDCFESVTIMTYCFHGSMMAPYLAAGGVEFDMKAIHGGNLIDWHEVDERVIKSRLRDLITVYEGKSNAVGDTKVGSQPLSATWYKNQLKGSNRDGLEALKKGLLNFFKNEARTATKFNLWTTFKDFKGRLKGNGYSMGFVPNNLRATNEFKHKTAAAYTCNTFMQPVVKQYLIERGVDVYEDLFSLSEMLQWIWRTAIREYQPVKLYIPSQRMRELFHAWLKADTTADLFSNLGLAMPTSREATTSSNKVAA